MAQKIVICGAGFLGGHIARTWVSSGKAAATQLQISSRQPQKTLDALLKDTDTSHLSLSAVPVDITRPETLESAFRGANVVISLVGIMHGTPSDFERIQWKGAENVAIAAHKAGARLVHFSAIGADADSHIPYVRTKGLAERSVLDICPSATIIRPSLVFGPGDDFFGRFAKLSAVLPFLPVFGGGTSKFQPVYVGDVAKAVEIICTEDERVRKVVDGKIIEAGGPDVRTYRELMQMVLKYTGRTRPILSLPFQVGLLQGYVLEKLPVNLFTVTRAQIEQLKSDNIVSTLISDRQTSFKNLLEQDGVALRSMDQILPTYL